MWCKKGAVWLAGREKRETEGNKKAMRKRIERDSPSRPFLRGFFGRYSCVSERKGKERRRRKVGKEEAAIKTIVIAAIVAAQFSLAEGESPRGSVVQSRDPVRREGFAQQGRQSAATAGLVVTRPSLKRQRTGGKLSMRI